MWRLWGEDKIRLTEMDTVSIDEVDQACRMLDAIEAAQARAQTKAGKA